MRHTLVLQVHCGKIVDRVRGRVCDGNRDSLTVPAAWIGLALALITKVHLH